MREGDKFMVEVKNLSKSFRSEIAVDNVTVTFRSGAIHGLVGPNGSGKTVLMKLICGLLMPTSGEVIVDDKIVGRDVDFPPSLGAIIETPGFIPYLSGYRNLKDLADIRKRVGRAEIAAAMEKLGLDAYARKRAGTYSLGMRQRLGIAQAIMEDPSLLVLDEPMNGLDNRSVELVRALLLQLRDEGKTILLASHHMEDIQELCDTVCSMDCGRLSMKKGW